jgi:hypothetical protein
MALLLRRWRIALFLVSAAAIVTAVCLHRTRAAHARPVATVFRAYLNDPHARMVAYAPMDAVQDDPQHRVMLQQLTLLRQKFDGLSLYQSGPATPAIVELAHALGYRAVLLTVWDPRSESEIATAASIVNRHAGDMALALSIGSEGLMEKRYTLADMEAARAELLDRTPGAQAVELTTTEPWWLYLRPEYHALNSFGDFTCINVHVVWDTDIVDPALAATWTRDRAAEVRKALPRPLLIRELGLPGAGSSPRDVVHGSAPLTPSQTMSRSSQAAFWRAWLQLDQRPPAVVFEAIDNPEKHWRDFESSWGLLSPELAPWPAWEVFPRLATTP